MSTISTCIIVKNEIKNLPFLVDDLRKFSDEIIIVDTGSDDGTLEWLKENQDNVLKLHHFHWVNDFSAARNYSFSLATSEWIFWCDADDRISNNLINDIINIKGVLGTGNSNMYIMNYLFAPNCEVPRMSLMKRDDNPIWYGMCHEYVEVDNQVCGEFDKESMILHQREHTHSDRNLNIFIDQILQGNALTSRDIYYYSCELRDNGYMDKAGEVVLKSLYDIWYVDAWNAITSILVNRWVKHDYIDEGLTILNNICSLRETRGDVKFIKYYIEYIVNQDLHAFIDGCKDVINTELSDLDVYLENKIYSKVMPAINLYRFTDDLTMIDIIKEYKDVSIDAYNFLKEIE